MIEFKPASHVQGWKPAFKTFDVYDGDRFCGIVRCKDVFAKETAASKWYAFKRASDLAPIGLFANREAAGDAVLAQSDDVNN